MWQIGLWQKLTMMGIASLRGGSLPVAMIILIGGQRSLTAQASRRPSIDPGMFTSVMRMRMSLRDSRISIASSALAAETT
jgi:hypothetical protein